MAIAVGFAGCGSESEDEASDKDIEFSESGDKGKTDSEDNSAKYVAVPHTDFNWDEVEGGVSIRDYQGTEKYIILPSEINGETVVEVGMINNAGVEGVEIPATVKVIGENAFYGASAKEVKLPEGLETIKTQAFMMSKSLKHIILPESLKTLEDRAFALSVLEDIVIPGSVETISESAFASCSELKTVEIKDGVKTIGDNAFKNCDVLEVAYVPASVEEVGYNCFFRCGENLIVYGKEGSAIEKYSVEDEWAKYDEFTYKNY